MKKAIYVVNRAGLGDFIAITPLLRKLYYIFDQKTTTFWLSTLSRVHKK